MTTAAATTAAATTAAATAAARTPTDRITAVPAPTNRITAVPAPADRSEAVHPGTVVPAEAAAATGPAPPASVVPPVAGEHAPPRLRLLRYEPDPDRPALRRPPTASTRRPHVVPVDRPADPADLRRGIERVLRLALEVLDGRRPLAQLAPHLAPSAVRYLRAAMAQRPPLREPARMTSLHVGRPGDGAAEVAAVYRRGPRARALAARFERTRPGPTPVRTSRTDGPQWRCVTLRLL